MSFAPTVGTALCPFLAETRERNPLCAVQRDYHPSLFPFRPGLDVLSQRNSSCRPKIRAPAVDSMVLSL